jgi:hypothetical protein
MLTAVNAAFTQMFIMKCVLCYMRFKDMRFISLLSLLLAVTLMAGCFHENDDSSSEEIPQAVEDQSAAGIYRSILSDFVSEAYDHSVRNPVDAIITNTGEARFFIFGSTGTPLMDTQLVGNVNVTADNLTATLKEYSDGNAQTSTVDLDGTIVTKDGAWGSYTWGLDFGRFVLNYFSTYENTSALSKLEGIWTFSQASSSGLTFTLALTVDPDGTVFGSTTEGCVFNGRFKIIDSHYNVYRLLLDTSLCGDLDGAYRGLATFSVTQPHRYIMFGVTNQDHSLCGMVFSPLQP